MDDILSLVNPDIRKTFDMGEVLLRLVDDNRLLIHKPKYGRNLITAFAQIHGLVTAPACFLYKITDSDIGFEVGIIANQTPVINGDEASKGAQFVRMCNQQYVILQESIYLRDHALTCLCVQAYAHRFLA